MCRYNIVIVRHLHTRGLSNQKIEAKVGCNVLNKMTFLDMPIAVRIN
jgi:hypothetical protein